LRILCSRCDKALGEQEPFDNPAEVKVKCLDCLEKEKAEASRFQPMPRPGEKLEIMLGNNLKGTTWIAEEEMEKLSLWELAVSGRKFFCSNDTREEFQKHLISIEDEEPEITFLYSMSLKIAPPMKSRKRTKLPTELDEKSKSIHYNCTAKLPKHYAQRIFDEKANRMTKFLDIMVDAIYKTCHEDCKEKGGLCQNI
jgi:hypothetical protein